MSLPYDTIHEASIITEELQKLVSELSDENEQLESRCYKLRIVAITLFLAFVASIALNVMLYDANGKYDAEMSKQNDIVFQQDALIKQKEKELLDCRNHCQYMQDGMAEAIKKGFVQKMPPAMVKSK